MSIEKFFTTSLTVSRESFTGNKATFGNVATILAHIQQATAEDTERFGLRSTKAFSIWCANNSNVQEGDKLTDGAGNVYGVKAVMEDNYAGNNKHFRLACERVVEA